uniref:protein-tyrosine-phosphatase n=1 Tax=Strongyloides venezuelensis TaxID=75913 RepID=A0A0K0FHU4_STRVS
MSLNYPYIKHISLVLLIFSEIGSVKSSIFLDWTTNIPDDLNVLHYQLDYTPNVGEPPPKFIFPIRYTNTVINNTLPAHDYKISLVAVLADGAHIPLINKYIPSSPYPPIYRNISTAPTEAIIEYEPPQGQTVTYYIEYFPSNNEDLSNYVETQATIVRLKSLLPKTLYIIRLYSVYKGMPSDTFNEESFMTKGIQSKGKENEKVLFGIKTLPPFFKPIQTTPQKNSIDHSQTLSPLFFVQQAKEFFATSTTLQPPPATIKPFSFDTLNFKKEFSQFFTVPSSPYKITTQQSTIHASSSTLNYPDFTKPDYFKPQTNNWNFKTPPKNNNSSTSNILFTTISSSSDASTIPTITTKTLSTKMLTSLFPRQTTMQTTTNAVKSEEVIVLENVKFNNNNAVKFNKVSSSNNSMNHQNEIKKVDENIQEENEEDIIFEDRNEFLSSTPTTTTTLEALAIGDKVTLQLTESGELNLEKDGDNLIVKWENPETILCDTYIANLTYLTNNRESVIEATNENEVKFKFPEVDKALITIYCSYDGVIVNTWLAQRISDFTKPKPVEYFKVTSISTDEFYLSSVNLTWNNIYKNSDKYYNIMVSYSYGKTSQNKKTVIVEQGNYVVIDKLNPATLYTFTIKNISSEFSNLSSKARGLRQLTPPVITSTVYPGQISSTSININFGESDPEHLFDSYELIFVSSTKNITKSVKKDEEKSFTFNKLIPGKTYTFILYTIYKSIKSRPVISKVTTYPLKVSKLYPILGAGYASLYWENENIGCSTTKYRLSYVTETKSGDRKTATVLLKDVTKHRFEELDYDLYYTFTITIIMGEGNAEAESESETITVIIKQYTSNPPSLRRQGMRELNVVFDNDKSFNTDTNGNVDNYAIIVTENLSSTEDEYDLKTWFDVKAEEKWTSYRASPSTFNPFKNGVKKASFVIGEEECDKRKLSEPYCNGALKSNVDYYVKIRAYTERNVAIETEWVSVHGTVDEDSPKEVTKRLPCHMYLNGCPRNHSSERFSHYILPIYHLN